ncbi:MAG: pyruvate, phosphate dikinase [Verrucomicrobiota bacterium]
MSKYVYSFSPSDSDGDGSQKALLGGKGANLAEMSRIGLPVPSGFTMSTEVCTAYYENDRNYPEELAAQVEEAVAKLEEELGKKFGDAENPLLVSVRSGARESMPGMMDTILNLGMNDSVVEGLAKKTGNERFAWDSYRRFLQMYGDVVMGVQTREGEDHEPFEHVMDLLKSEVGAVEDNDLTTDHLKDLVGRFKGLIKDRTGDEFPEAPMDQLWGAAGAVFGSWMNDRAMVYRRKYDIPHEWGTAVNVQAMVFGNAGDTSGTGVAFTRDPANGEKVYYGEYLMNAQGEDVVAGVRTPKKLADMPEDMPNTYKELGDVFDKLESHFKDVQDVEFTVEDGKLYMLQTRNGKRTGLAALNIAVDMVNEGLVDEDTAFGRIPAGDLEQLLAPIFDADAESTAETIGTGLPAGPGAATGKIFFNATDAVTAAEAGDDVILVRIETSPEDLRGMIAAKGILTSRGGSSSHAALVARQMGKVCICGATAILIDYEAKTVTAGGVTLREGEDISINGTNGNVYAGSIETAPSEIIQVLVDKTLDPKESALYGKWKTLMSWCDRTRKLGVRTNSDDPVQVKRAIGFGAEGIGLTRTEHMFFEGDRIDAVREMILAENLDARKKALAKLLPYQREDFTGIFEALEGRPATIRLLDPPLHEFVPHTKEQQMDLSKKINIPVEKIISRVAALHEFNPMLGHRGCRLGIVYPEITEMQARAIFEAAADVKAKGIEVNPEVMVPLVGFKRELDLQSEVIHRVAAEVKKEKGVEFDYLVGTMIELPRAAVTANEIAETADFFSFGTNDLTQTTLGLSRDDSAGFMGEYQEADVFSKNPFAAIDQDGVGQLVQLGVERGRSTKPNLKLGICGEHGGEPSSVKFCHRVGLDYVSCSPFRIPIARMAAAQAVLDDKKG